MEKIREATDKEGEEDRQNYSQSSNPDKLLKTEFEIIQSLLKFDVNLNDICDCENIYTPLNMLFLDKKLMKNPIAHPFIIKLAEFLLLRGAFHEVPETLKPKLEKRLSNIKNESFLNHLMSSTPEYISQNGGKEKESSSEGLSGKRGGNIQFEGEENGGGYCRGGCFSNCRPAQ